jgi:type VI secretion system secreted protein Hcp
MARPGGAMAADMFVKIGDIQGESTDAKHLGEIDVTSWSWGVAQISTSAGGAGGAGSGKASFQELLFTHAVDKASPGLLKACATGQHIPDATLTVRKPGAGQPEFLVIRMTDVIVTSVHPGSSAGGPALAENVSVSFSKVDLEYRPQKPDGSLDAGVHFTFDIKNNRPG